MTPRKKNVEPLARERIVAAAMRIIDAEGLDALSMRRLGAELGVNPMAAYYHVPNKAALYDLVLEAVMAGVDTVRHRPGAPLAEQFKQAARAYRAAILAHPRADPGARDALAAHGGGAAAGRADPRHPLRAPVSRRTRRWRRSTCVAQYILGGAMGYYHHEVDGEAGEQRDFEALDPAEFPHMTRMLAEGRYLGSEAEFEFGLDAIVRGLLGGPRFSPEGGA